MNDATLHKCCASACPGYPWRASVSAHPAETCGPISGAIDSTNDHPTLDPTAADLLRRARLPGCAAVLDRDPGAALLIHALVTDVARTAHPDGDALARLRAAEAAMLPLARAVWDGRAAKGESGEQMGARP